jgi:hypothetical protein
MQTYHLQELSTQRIHQIQHTLLVWIIQYLPLPMEIPNLSAMHKCKIYSHMLEVGLQQFIRHLALNASKCIWK